MLHVAVCLPTFCCRCGYQNTNTAAVLDKSNKYTDNKGRFHCPISSKIRFFFDTNNVTQSQETDFLHLLDAGGYFRFRVVLQAELDLCHDRLFLVFAHAYNERKAEFPLVGDVVGL